jgi:hypothetical protein
MNHIEIIPWPPPIGPGVKLIARQELENKEIIYQDVYIEANGSTVDNFQRKAEQAINRKIEEMKTNVATKDKN